MNIIHTLLGHSSFWIWRNALEICIFSILFYQLALYLRKDNSKNLLPYFYGYCAVACAAYFLQLSALSSFLFIFAPAAVCLFILFHQETLQRNFVALKTQAVQQPSFEGSIEILIRCMLIALNNKQEVSVLIEYQDKLDDFVDCTYSINSPLNHDLLMLLLESPSIDHKKMIWITHAGMIRGINATWHDSYVPSSAHSINSQPSLFRAMADTAGQAHGATQLPTQRDLHEWYTGKTDCLTIELDPTTRTFAVTAHGNTNPQVSSHHVLAIIKKHNLILSQPQKSRDGKSMVSSVSPHNKSLDRDIRKGTLHDQN